MAGVTYFPIIAKNLKSCLEGQFGHSFDGCLCTVLNEGWWYLIIDKKTASEDYQSELVGLVRAGLRELPCHNNFAASAQLLEERLVYPLENVGQQVFHLLRLEIIIRIRLNLISRWEQPLRPNPHPSLPKGVFS
jgi:hypothetical protein